MRPIKSYSGLCISCSYKVPYSVYLKADCEMCAEKANFSQVMIDCLKEDKLVSLGSQPFGLGCQCGSESVGGLAHSAWCPKHEAGV